MRKDNGLCENHTLKVYLNTSQEWRNEEETQCLLGLNKSHSLDSISTVSR